MNERTKTGMQILQVAILVGLIGNVMLRATPWGLNAFLFVTAFVAGLFFVWRRHRPELINKTNIALASAMVFFASMFVLRDAEEVLVFDTLAIIVIMGVLILASFDIKAHISGVSHYIVGAIGAGLNSAFGGFMLIGADIDWKSIPVGNSSRHLFAALRGIAIAMPLLLIFGGLFMAADAVFEGWVNRAINFDGGNLVGHVVLTSVLAWLTAGYLRASIFKMSVDVPAAAGVSSPHDSKGSTSGEKSQPDADNASTKEEAQPTASVSETIARDTSSYVANFTSEQTEPENGLPNNASILEHINISDPPDKKGSPPYEGGVAPDAVSADGDGAVLSAYNQSAKPKQDWQNFDNSILPSVFTLGTVETVIILGLLDLLFLGFVATQVPYLFGGMDLVQNTPDFKLADYARRGFEELVTVAVLVLPMLLVSHWLIRRDGSKASGVFKLLAGIQIALLIVIMASAGQRLLLLTGELGYGLTTDRFYAGVFMIWLAVVFGWFAVTVLRGARNRFAWGALWTAIIVLAGTNLLNPHAFIVGTNIKLMERGRDFDSYYNTDLSADSVPTLLNGLQSMSLEDGCSAKVSLHIRYRHLGETNDLRTLNWSRKHAFDLLRSNDAMIHQVEGCQTWVRQNLELPDSQLTP